VHIFPKRHQGMNVTQRDWLCEPLYQQKCEACQVTNLTRKFFVGNVELLSLVNLSALVS
jgi:hypothetical protein